MSESFWEAVALPLLGSFLLSLLAEPLLQPRPAPFWRRPPATLAIHLGLWLLFFTFEFVIFQRPLLAALVALGLLLLLVMVSNAKFRLLREPFVFQDFDYCMDALKHPRFYLPYLGAWRALAISVAAAAGLCLGIALEPWLPGRIGIAELGAGLGLLIAAGAGLLWLGTPRPLPTAFDPAGDLRRLGLLASLWQYGLAERAKSSLPRASPFSGAASANRDSPDIVAVQSESFLDARRLFAGIRPEVLREYDALKAAAVCHGRVEVSAWGANTVRTEFAFLSSLGAGPLGIHRFNPYRRLARQGVPTLPGFLKRSGYRTVCVHPYPASFYARDEVYPLLGFDEFIDIRGFDGAEKAGSYVCDVAVAEKVCGLLGGASSRPMFVFVITMENHGPLHLEKAPAADVERLYSVAPPAGCADLTAYLRHLGNADRMAGMLRDRLESLPGSSWLCWFGDHVPIMPRVYETMGYADGRTDYFIWGKGRTPHAAAKRDLKVEELGVLLLERAGLLIEPPMDA